MKDIRFTKYHALENDFLVIEADTRRMPDTRLSELALAICNRRTGPGADGIIYLSASKAANRKFDIYNADGGWAEKSGNGLRIAAAHLAAGETGGKSFTFETATSLDTVTIGKKNALTIEAAAELGKPEFESAKVPVKTGQNYVINHPLTFGEVALPVTCLSVGNPHTVLVVDNFDFDWKTLGADIEIDKRFPNGTNVEFVRPVNRKKIKVADWERGAGATGSSGTGAAAAVCAMVMLGVADRQCEVVFETGSLFVNWREEDDVVELTGPVTYVMEGMFRFA